MKAIVCPSKKRLTFLMLIFLLMSLCTYIFNREYTYQAIQVVMSENTAVEYGTANYDIHNYIEKVEGEIISIKKDIDTNVVGEQEAVLEIQKENIVKEVPLVISVIDSVSPTIELKEEKITITQGNDYDLLENIESIKDDIDGDIPFRQELEENSTFYYHLEYDSSTIGQVGEHEIKVLAKDKNGNTETSSFILEVVAPKRRYYSQTYHNLSANSHSNDLVSIAYSYIGYPYISGSNGPNGFDCSGFVQFVYSKIGTSVSRSTTTQLYDGLGVSYEDAKPGDIIVWGYSGGNATHTALYVGNGTMVHAANPRQGVIESSVAGWLSGSGTQILSIRRIG